MTRQLALIAVLVLGQVPSADSNKANDPVRDQTSDKQTAGQSSNQQIPSQPAIPPVGQHVDAKNGDSKATESKKAAEKYPSNDAPARDNIAIRGLHVQESQSSATWATFWVGIVQVIVGVLGITAVVVTLAYTVKATKATEKAAKAATVSAKAARKALLCDRAWVSTRNGKIEPMKVGEPLRSTIQFFNSGKTPAVNLRGRFSIICDMPPTNIEGIALSYGDETDDPPTYVRPLGPNASCDSEAIAHHTVSQSMADGISRGDIIIYVFGVVRYGDVCGTGVHHETRYCYTVNPSNWRLQTYGKYNDMT